MSDACYISLPLFLFHSFSQVASNFTFTSETSLILLLLKFLLSNATESLLVKTWNTNKKKDFLTVYEMLNWDASF